MSKKKRMNPSDKLVLLLREHGYEIPDEYEFRSLNPSPGNRSAGAWIWTIYCSGCDIGSQQGVRELLKCNLFEDGAYGDISGEIV